MKLFLFALGILSSSSVYAAQTMTCSSSYDAIIDGEFTTHQLPTIQAAYSVQGLANAYSEISVEGFPLTIHAMAYASGPNGAFPNISITVDSHSTAPFRVHSVAFSPSSAQDPDQLLVTTVPVGGPQQPHSYATLSVECAVIDASSINK